VRDDFDERIKRALVARVGNLCSNPMCRALTSGPHIDPTKSVNLGVAAHITAASPDGPRVNPSLSPEERRNTENAIWLCQNCAKLVDNDVARYPEAVLRGWKSKAEMVALSAVGKPGGLDLRSSSGQIIRLEVGERIQLYPVIPRSFERDFYILKEVGPDCLVVFKESSQATIHVPATGISIVHRTKNYAVVRLQGRLQWITPKPHRGWAYFPDEPSSDPDGYFGLWKPSSFADPRVNALTAQFPTMRWFREDRVSSFLSHGWHIFYDEDGRYFRVRGSDCDQILLCDHP